MHTLSPLTAYDPFRHDVQFPFPTPETVPFAQASQKVAPFWFAGKEYLPAMQVPHVVFRPETPEKYPARHWSHPVPPCCVKNVPARHAAHVLTLTEPMAVEYVPGLHGWHPYAPNSEYVPARHALQSKMEAAPTTVEYVPALQFVQVSDEGEPSTVE